MDELFEKASIESDQAKRTKIFYEIQEILARDIPIIWLYDYPSPTGYNNNFGGFPMGPSSWGENYANVWWKGGRDKK